MIPLGVILWGQAMFALWFFFLRDDN